MSRIVYSGKIVRFDKDTKQLILEHFGDGLLSFTINPEITTNEEYFTSLIGETVDIFVVNDLIKYINIQNDEEIF
jgi:hypothetical protein